MSDINIYNNDNWVMRPDSAAKEITGEGLTLDKDVLIYFKMSCYTQGCIDRIAKTPDYTLADEIIKDPGYIMMGDPEKIRAAMHGWVNQFIDGAKIATKPTEAAKQ